MTTVSGTPTTVTLTTVATQVVTSTVLKIIVSTVTPTPTPTKIKLRIFRPGTVEKVRKWMEAMIEAFEKEHPNIEVEPILWMEEYFTKLRSLVASGRIASPCYNRSTELGL